MNNTEKKIDWIFEALKHQLEDIPANDGVKRVFLLNNADGITADIETEKENNIPIQDKTEDAFRDSNTQ